MLWAQAHFLPQARSARVGVAVGWATSCCEKIVIVSHHHFVPAAVAASMRTGAAVRVPW